MKVVVSVGEARDIVMKALKDAGRLPEDCDFPGKVHYVDTAKPVAEQALADLFTYTFKVDVDYL